MKTMIIVLTALMSVLAWAHDIDMPPDTAPGIKADTQNKIQAAKERRRKTVVARKQLTPEERKAWKIKAEQAKAETRKAKAMSLAQKYMEAKAACTNCYRVVSTNGVCVGMTKEQYDQYQKDKEEKKVKSVRRAKGGKARPSARMNRDRKNRFRRRRRTY